MNIGILDDDIKFIDNFTFILSKYLPLYFHNYELVIMNDQYITNLNNNNFDILFIDIDLHNYSGIELSRLCKNSLVIYVSSRNDLVFDALATQPFHFIRKTHLEVDTSLTVSLLNNYFKNRNIAITLKQKNSLINLRIKDIIYIQSDKHEIMFISANNTYSIRDSMKNTLKNINNYSIIQIQKSLAINMDHTQSIIKDEEIILDNGNIFTINRFYKKLFLNAYKEYLLK